MAQSGAADVIEQIRALEKRKAELLETAKAEALARANEAIAELGELGFAYRLAPGADKKAEVESTARSKHRTGEGLCPICGFATIPPHDGRSHRGQKKKSAFSAKELSERGLAKAS